MIRALAASLPAIVLLAAPLSAKAAGPYDGTWQVDAPSAGQRGAATQLGRCEALRLRFTVRDNQIHGSLARSPHAPSRVTESEGRGAAPVVGTVQPDGVITAKWQDYDVTGKFTGDKAEVRWNGACGPRVATGGRVASNEGAGSSTDKH